MTTDHHTPITTGAAAKAATINAPLGELDAAIVRLDYVPDQPASPSDDEFLRADGTFAVPDGTGGTNGHVIQSEGTDQTQRTHLDFQGTGVTVTNGASATEVLMKTPVLSNIEVYDANATWTKPAGLAFVVVEVIGGGGGSGGVAGATDQVAVSGSGGGGGYSKKLIPTASLGATEAVTVGAGGTGGTAGANNGSGGGTSSFGAHCSASGGSGGNGESASATVPRPGATTGAGGAGSGGDVNAKGSGGLRGASYSATSGVPGAGGAAGQYSGFTTVSLTNGTSVNGSAYGGGASGTKVTNAATNFAGGDGAAGVVIVHEYVYS